MRARTAVQITLTVKDHRRAQRLAKVQDLKLATFLREAALETIGRIEAERGEAEARKQVALAQLAQTR